MVNRIYVLNELQKYAVFTSKIVLDILEKKKNYVNLLLYRLSNAKLIFRIERDKYTVYKDALLVASRILWPSYISGWSALQYHNLTEQLPSTIDVFTTRSKKKKEIEFANAKIRFIKSKTENLFGFNKVHYKGMEIFVASKEKAIADSFAFNLVSESELLEIISKNRDELEIKLISKYLMKIIRKPWRKKAKKFLEKVN